MSSEPQDRPNQMAADAMPASAAAQDKDPDKDKAVTVVINGREKTLTGREVTYQELVALAFPTAPNGANVLVSITYRRGAGNKPEGALLAGQSVRLKERMIFVVTATDKS